MVRRLQCFFPAGACAILLGFVEQRRLVSAGWLQVIPLSAAALSYGIAAPLGGRGFITAFVAGLVSAWSTGRTAVRPPPTRRRRLTGSTIGPGERVRNGAALSRCPGIPAP